LPVTNTSGVLNATLSLRDPLNVVYTGLNLSYASGTTWTYSFAPNQVGTWTIVAALITQNDNTSYTFLGSGDTFTVSAASTGGPGGGGGQALPPIQVIPASPLLQAAAAACGNRLCDAGESPTTCGKDCVVNLDTVLTCLLTNQSPCNWEEDWFAALITYLVLGIGLFALTAHIMAAQGRPIRWLKNRNV